MKTYTVSELADLAGISVRTLHHYDAIGLLRPAFTDANRYRRYGREQLLRLQQILIHRELEMPLADIARVLDAPDADRLTTLARQRARIHERAERYRVLLSTIDRTIEDLKGLHTMTDKDLYEGVVSDAKQAEYEAWLVERFGSGIRKDIAASKVARSSMSDADRRRGMEELEAIEGGLAEGLRRGVPPQAKVLDPLLERHRQWVTGQWGRECPPEAYAGLADMYLAHPDFIARYEQIEKGFADYLATAMRAWVRRQE